MRTVIHPYKRFSASARALSAELGLPIRLRDMPRNGCIINWGSSSMTPELRGSVVINSPRAVAVAANKLSLLRACPTHGVPFAVSREGAVSQLSSGEWDGIVARRILNGHSGRGISIHTSTHDVPECPLYTSLVRGYREWRVMFFGDNIVTVYRKCRRNDDEPANEGERYVRSVENGWVFVDKPVSQVHPSLMSKFKSICLEVKENVGLDFGAVDIIQEECSGRLYTLEVNTAFGMTGRTIERASSALVGILPAPARELILDMYDPIEIDAVNIRGE